MNAVRIGNSTGGSRGSGSRKTAISRCWSGGSSLMTGLEEEEEDSFSLLLLGVVVVVMVTKSPLSSK